MANVSAADLLVGADQDFVINLYLAVLGRWPDPAGLAHFTAMVEGNPAARPAAIRELANSPEAIQRGAALAIPDPLLPGEPIAALSAQLALRSEYLHRLVSAAPPPAALPTEAVAPLFRDIRAELDALRRELRERLAEPAGFAPPPAPAVPDMADYVNDMLALSEARMELRIRGLEKRLP